MTRTEAQILEADLDVDLCVLVRGTQEMPVAREHALAALAREGYDEAGAAASILDTTRPQVGWYRTLGWCICGGGHDSEVIPASPGARGAYPGVMFVRYGRLG
jgi:hypothetical protein